MENLIMLLDDYEERIVGVHSVWDKINDKETAWIISKKFWFIEQLIKRNQIDLWKLFTSDIEIPLREVDGWNDVKIFPIHESLLMILSIQDNPLEYLCSILKE
jgi:hypothetical protein